MDRRYFIVQQYHVYVQDILVTLLDWPPMDAETIKVAAIRDAVQYRGEEVGRPIFLEVLEDHGMSVEDEVKVPPELRDALEDAGDLLDRQQRFVQGIHDVREVSADKVMDIMDRDTVSIPRLLSRLTIKQRIALYLLHMNASLCEPDLTWLSNGALSRGSVYSHLSKLEDQGLVDSLLSSEPDVHTVRDNIRTLGDQTIDGVTLKTGDRVLVEDLRPKASQSIQRRYRLTDLGKVVVKSFDDLDMDEIQDVIDTPSWFVRKWQDFRLWLAMR